MDDKNHSTIRRLNPYYNGKYSMRTAGLITVKTVNCLNPYYNGKYSMRLHTAL